MTERYFCKSLRRRGNVRDTRNPDGSPRLNGIDYLEVLSNDQTLLELHFIHPVPHLLAGTLALTSENFVITGGTRVQAIRVMQVDDVPENPNALRLTVSQRGDFSTYRLQLVTSSVNDSLPTGFEPPLDGQLATLDFSFKVNCPSEFDCPQPPPCPPVALPAPQIDYLAKDYASFRQLMLDRLAVTLPDWQERNPADVGIALVEVLAYSADHLSYYQDAVATETYLGTARQRTSVRRHGRLLGYTMHEGCNARAWVQVQVQPGIVNLPLAVGTPFLTKVEGKQTTLDPTSRDYREALAQGATVFEALHDQRLFASHNAITFYTWSDDNCCLSAGATRATLLHEADKPLHLRPGDVLVLEERLSPETGREEDAELSRRHAVRLQQVMMQVSVTAVAIATLQSQGASADLISALQTIQDVTFDHEGDLLQRLEDLVGSNLDETSETQLLAVVEPQLRDPLTDQLVVEVSWYAQDAPPFSLCVSKTIDGNLTVDMAIARGNIVLTDHGQTRVDEPLAPSLVPPDVNDPVRYRPRLAIAEITHAAPFDARGALTQAAIFAAQHDPRQALPAVRLTSEANQQWEARWDLLNSDRFDRGFVVEMGGSSTLDRSGRLRFGDNIFGQRPALGTQFLATYRVGSGRSGNVGAEAIAHLVIASGDGILAVRNPLPGVGGTDPEPMQTVKMDAPQAFRVQQRAVTEEDYAEVAARHPEVQKARATRRWTGSWYTWFLTVDRTGGLPVDATFEQDLRAFLERFRLAGYDLEVDAPSFVPLDIIFSVCVKAGYYASDVKAALLETFSRYDLRDGRRGFFHPDNVTFGQSVYLSPLVAATMQVPGVQWVDFSDRTNPLHRFQRWGRAANHELDNGEIPIGRLEIARLDNDPNAPENGRINFLMEGGQ